MARIDATAVRLILNTNVTILDASIDAIIGDANNLVTEILGDDSELTASMKASIEKWLTAHMIVCTVERMEAKAKGGPAEVTYTGKWGKGLESTSYGQMAMTLDTTGKLRAVMSGKAATIFAVET